MNGHKVNSDSPLVSIVTPVLNGIKYIEINISSVLGQNYSHIEHIFVDGGSKDGTLEILLKYQARFPNRIRVISEPAKGVGQAVNRGFASAKGQIFGWIDSDDVYEPDAIKTAVDYFRAHSDAYFLYGGCNMIDESGKVISSFTIKDFDLHEAVTRWHYIVFCSAFYDRSVIMETGGLNDLGNDLDFYIRVYSKFYMHRIGKTLANWRLHSSGISLAPAPREKRIRSERVQQDFILCLKNGGNIFSPRCVRYYASIVSPAVNGLRPVLGRFYPFIRKCFGIGDLY